jgi:hypothetical protein
MKTSMTFGRASNEKVRRSPTTKTPKRFFMGKDSVGTLMLD